MPVTRRALLALVLLLLFISSATVVVAASANGRPSPLTLNPAPASTEAASITLTGKVAGHFQMKVLNVTTGLSRSFVANGPFSVTIPLVGGVNTLVVSGSDRPGRSFQQAVVITRVLSPVAIRLAALPALTADGVSDTTLTAQVVDANGTVVTRYSGVVTFASSEIATLRVLTPSVPAPGGVAKALLRHGTVPGTATITATAAGLPSVSMPVAVGKQVATRIQLVGNPAALAAAPGSQGYVRLLVLDQNGKPMFTCSESLTVRLTSSDTTLVHFDGQATKTVTWQGPEAAVTVNGSWVSGLARISGTVLSGPALPVTSLALPTAIVGRPYGLQFDPVPNLVAGTGAKIYIRVLDANGFQVSTSNYWNVQVVRSVNGGPEVVPPAPYGGPFAVTYGMGGVLLDTSVPGTYRLRASAGGLLDATVMYTVYP